MNKTKKYHYKVFGALFTVAFIFALGSVNIGGNEGSLFQGKLTITKELSDPQIQVLTQDIQTGEQVVLAVTENGKNIILPKKWQINVSHFVEHNIESLYASTEPGAKAYITINADSNYTFYAPQNPGLYKISLIDLEKDLTTIISNLNVIK